MNHYWVKEKQFLAGEYPRNIDDASSQAKMDSLIKLGITAFIDLTHGDDGMKPYTDLFDGRTLLYQRFPICDLSVPASRGLTREILDTIDGHIHTGRAVYVHCWGGVGRTGVVVGCWLSRHGFPGKSALARLNELWRGNPKSAFRRSPETPEQSQYVIEWNEASF